ncbi:MAG: hypothetical protein LBN38_01850 [Verrucomicrobiota bacterium]|jgi:chorismate mutase|nr:hypothetical protein [Verrucomicrobiota bacterium]
MGPETLQELRGRLRAVDEDLLRALDALARTDRRPTPEEWTLFDSRLPPPPIQALLAALPKPPENAPSKAPAQTILHHALRQRQQLAVAIAEQKAAAHPHDVRAALEKADRDTLLSLLTDLPAELQVLEHIRKAAERTASSLSPALAAFLWREHLIPWAKQTEVEHLLQP